MGKWYHAGSKVYGLEIDYAEACERVYGEPYPQWKKKHQKPASKEQMAIFESSKELHARTDPSTPLLPSAGAAAKSGTGGSSAGHSNVCGGNCDPLPAAASADVAVAPRESLKET